MGPRRLRRFCFFCERHCDVFILSETVRAHFLLRLLRPDPGTAKFLQRRGAPVSDDSFLTVNARPTRLGFRAAFLRTASPGPRERRGSTGRARDESLFTASVRRTEFFPAAAGRQAGPLRGLELFRTPR